MLLGGNFSGHFAAARLSLKSFLGKYVHSRRPQRGVTHMWLTPSGAGITNALHVIWRLSLKGHLYEREQGEILLL
jgi:hypothetical protein